MPCFALPLLLMHCSRVKVMVFDATFNNISVIFWPSVLLVEATGVPRTIAVAMLNFSIRLMSEFV